MTPFVLFIPSSFLFFVIANIDDQLKIKFKGKVDIFLKVDMLIRQYTVKDELIRQDTVINS